MPLLYMISVGNKPLTGGVRRWVMHSIAILEAGARPLGRTKDDDGWKKRCWMQDMESSGLVSEFDKDSDG